MDDADAHTAKEARQANLAEVKELIPSAVSSEITTEPAADPSSLTLFGVPHQQPEMTRKPQFAGQEESLAPGGFIA